MNNNLQVFQNEEFGEISVWMVDGKPYFPATECAKILGYSNPKDAIRRHTKGGVFHAPLTNGGTQKVKFIPEGDLYRLIIRSKLPAAERFEKLVFDEILPSIRKTGAYVTPETLEKMLQSSEFTKEVLKNVSALQQKNAALSECVEHLAPKAQYHDLIWQTQNTVPVSFIAKEYGMSATAFNRLLHELRIQYKLRETWILYNEYASKGYTKARTFYTPGNVAVVHTYWTMRGRIFLYDKLTACGILPVTATMPPKIAREC